MTYLLFAIEILVATIWWLNPVKHWGIVPVLFVVEFLFKCVQEYKEFPLWMVILRVLTHPKEAWHLVKVISYDAFWIFLIGLVFAVSYIGYKGM